MYINSGEMTEIALHSEKMSILLTRWLYGV